MFCKSRISCSYSSVVVYVGVWCKHHTSRHSWSDEIGMVECMCAMALSCLRHLMSVQAAIVQCPASSSMQVPSWPATCKSLQQA